MKIKSIIFFLEDSTQLHSGLNMFRLNSIVHLLNL